MRWCFRNTRNQPGKLSGEEVNAIYCERESAVPEQDLVRKHE